MKYTLTLQENHLDTLKKLVLQSDGKERPCIMLCGVSHIKNDPWDGGAEMRFLSRMIIPLPEAGILENSAEHVSWDTTAFRNAMKQAKEEDLAICLVHSHPEKLPKFSAIDDENELDLFSAMYKRSGSANVGLSLILTSDGKLVATVCTANLVYHPIKLIRVFGNRFTFFYKEKNDSFTREEFSRQALALGPALNTDLAQLRIAVVGCGATGSATAHLLTRLGVGQILLIDKDQVERSNLSRLYGATGADADLGSYKAEVLAKYLAGVGMGARVRFANTWVGDESCRDAVKACDLIFSCTDDNSGRIYLNRISYFYITPVIDMGISIDPMPPPEIGMYAAQGRFTVLQPSARCLICRKTVDQKLAQEEQLKRNDPEGFERLKEEAYVTGSGNPSPAVITFTSEVATMSANELINRMVGFKKQGAQNHVVRFFDKGVDKVPAADTNEECPICRDTLYWGRGDMNPFLDQIN